MPHEPYTTRPAPAWPAPTLTPAPAPAPDPTWHDTWDRAAPPAETALPDPPHVGVQPPIDAVQAAFGHLAERAESPIAPMFAPGADVATPAMAAEREREARRQAEAKARVDAQIEADRAHARDQAIAEEMARDPDARKNPDAARARAAEFVDARGELAGLFETADPTSKPEARRENELTDAEFRQVAKMYADVKAGRGDLRLDTGDANKVGAAAMKAATLRDLARVMQTRSGRALVQGLVDNQDKDKDGKVVHHRTTIGDGGGFEAKTNPGANRSAQVTYNAGRVFEDPTAPTGAQAWRHLMRPDVVLYHELVHAHHITHGTVASGDVKQPEGPQDRKVDAAEYQASGLGEYALDPFSENRYRAERAGVSAGGAYDDVQPSAAQKGAYADWQDWWSDGRMHSRPSYKGAPL